MASPKDIQILVVDDEPFVLNLSVRILKKLGYERIQTASDGIYGLGFLDDPSDPIDLVLCDLNMPEMDGVEFMRQVHQLGWQGSLVLLSGENRRMLDTAMDLAKAYNLNILGSLQKPLDPAALEQLLGRLSLASKQRQYPQIEAITKQELQSGLTGMEIGELVLFYQPKVHMKSGEIRGVEALARWHHAERGLLGPGAFIPVAEKEGLIDALTFSIYRKAVQQVAEWNKAGIKLQVSVNFSINTFLRENFSRFLIDTVAEFGVSPEQLILEVTESQVTENLTTCQEIMMRLRLKKFGLSIDDFGTGNSSLVQLKHIPFTELKIDRAFVHGAATNSSARAILETSVDLARRLEMQTVAEGGETPEDWKLVESLGVDYFQGYFCAKPMSAADLGTFVKTWSAPKV
jgi:EAL domain-containing protein (putative c-di-GMP-specific phosphodiesterase class I)/AmiR/NasT family two-component response regulator